MSDTWITKYKGAVGGIPVEIQTHSDDGDLRVVVEAQEDITIPGSYDENSITMPFTIYAGDSLHIDGANEQELMKELIDFGFSKEATETVILHTRS